MSLNNDLFPSVALPGSRVRFAGQAEQDGVFEVAVETPVNFVYGSVPYAVMMASPNNLEDFVLGFSLTEGVIARPEDVRRIGVSRQVDGIVVDVGLVPERFRAHLGRRRNLTGRTSCGLCGIESIEALPFAAAVVQATPPVRASAIARALAALEDNQPLHLLTRAVHAAAWCDEEGRVLTVREDVGRHNALDKLIGARMRMGADRRGFVLVTSRASFEMVEKAAIFGAGTLVAISAPTSFAIQRATALGLTLAAIARPDGVTIFAGALAHEPGEVP